LAAESEVKVMMKLEIYQVSVQKVASVSRLARMVQKHDADLARQMRRASTSVPLNIAEGVHSRGGNKAVRLQTAMASARETMAAIDVSVAAEYISGDKAPELLDQLDRIVATLWKLVHRR
jgi:four helix bundle protein